MRQATPRAGGALLVRELIGFLDVVRWEMRTSPLWRRGGAIGAAAVGLSAALAWPAARTIGRALAPAVSTALVLMRGPAADQVGASVIGSLPAGLLACVVGLHLRRVRRSSSAYQDMRESPCGARYCVAAALVSLWPAALVFCIAADLGGLIGALLWPSYTAWSFGDAIALAVASVPATVCAVALAEICAGLPIAAGLPFAVLGGAALSAVVAFVGCAYSGSPAVFGLGELARVASHLSVLGLGLTELAIASDVLSRRRRSAGHLAMRPVRGGPGVRR